MSGAAGQGQEGTADTTPVESSSTPSTQGSQSTGNPIMEALNPPASSESTLPEGVSELAAGVLKGVPKELLPTLAPYVQEWDKGFQSKLTETKAQYADFEGMSASEAKAALELQQLIFAQPDKAIEWINQQRSGANEVQQNDVQNQSDDEEDFDLSALPKSLRDKLDKIGVLEQIVTKVAEAEISRTNAANEAKLMEEYTKVLADLKKEHGDFNEELVNTLVAAGKDPKQAVVEVQGYVKAEAAKLLAAHEAAPTVLGGQGQVITESGGKHPSQMTRAERVALSARYLQAQQE